MRTVFLGDSFTSGETNGDFSFCDYVSGTSYNMGISGTTIGEYSIYPVDGNSLLSVISRSVDVIKKADTIFIEYGINDTSAIMCGFATEDTVIVSFVKALDWLKQINPGAKIYFLTLSNKQNIIKLFGEKQCRYLEQDYFKGYSFKFPSNIWVDNYCNIIKQVEKRVVTVPMFGNFEPWMLGDDDLHPSDAGYKVIAENLKMYI